MSLRSDIMFPANHKTVFVLDHTPYFGISCDSLIEFDFLKTRGTAIIPLTPISKSLWTCSVESAIEYCRIVWDLFPQGKLVRFIVSDKMAHILNTWNSQTQNLTHIMNAMSMIGIPPRSVSGAVELSVLHGLRAAVETLSEPTDQQRAYLAQAEQPAKLVNRTRVICVTSARDDESMKSLEEIFHNVLIQQNKIENSFCIHHCHLVIINISPNNMESCVSNHPLKEMSSILSTEVHSIKAPNISSKFSHLILQHYDLASTTVTGIPMKEEQNASSSANYDVEIYHASNAHTAILKGNTADTAMIKALREGFDYETVTLKWCTPRGCSIEMQNCTAMHRITPVDVNSRPSSCLINFLLNGRSVMLEMPRKSGGKIISHLLAAHGGEIFIHTLYTARSVLEDPPSISEGPGGRVTDYRITDFGAFILNNKLLPIIRKPDDETPTPLTKIITRLDRQTRYWPLTISSTLIFNLRNLIEPLPELITKPELTEKDVVFCKQVIFNIIGLEFKHEPLHLTNVGHRSKGQKREEQYKILWSEIETLLKNNCHTKNHTAVYNCLLECHKLPEEVKNELPEKVELDQALRELDEIGKEVDPPARVSVIRATTDSPMSPPPLTTIRANSKFGSQSFLDIFLTMNKTKKRPDFEGRLNADGPVAKLYPNFEAKERGATVKPEISMEIDG